MSSTQPSISDLYSEDKNRSDLFWQEFAQDRYWKTVDCLDDLGLSVRLVIETTADLVVEIKEYLSTNSCWDLKACLIKPKADYWQLRDGPVDWDRPRGKVYTNVNLTLYYLRNGEFCLEVCDRYIKDYGDPEYNSTFENVLTEDELVELLITTSLISREGISPFYSSSPKREDLEKKLAALNSCFDKIRSKTVIDLVS